MNNKLSFEEAMKELELIVRRLEEGGQSLEKSIEDYEKGVFLKTYCDKILKEATLRVETIQNMEESNGNRDS